MGTLLLIVVLLLLSAGLVSPFDFDVSAFPGGMAGLLAAVVIGLLLTRRI